MGRLTATQHLGRAGRNFGAAGKQLGSGAWSAAKSPVGQLLGQGAGFAAAGDAYHHLSGGAAQEAADRLTAENQFNQSQAWNELLATQQAQILANQQAPQAGFMQKLFKPKPQAQSIADIASMDGFHPVTASWASIQPSFEFLFKTAVGPMQGTAPQAPAAQAMQAPSQVPEPVRPNYDELRDAQLKLLEAKKHDEFVKWEKDQQKSEIERMKLDPDGAAIVGLAEQQNPGADLTLDTVQQTAQRAQQQHAQHVQMNPMAAGETLGSFISQSSQNPNSPQANPAGFVTNNAAMRRAKMGSFQWLFKQ
jgi:hypothetical protein